MLNYQSLTFPTDREFELSQIFRENGIFRPSHRQYTYMRRALEWKGYIKERIKGREEWWIKQEISRRFDPELLCRYTPESFTAKFFPGICLPLDGDKRAQIMKIMRSRGLAPRLNHFYWSYKAKHRTHLPRARPEPTPPKYVKIPRGSFCLWDFLDLNKMRRTPENFTWAKEELKNRNIQKLPNSWRYAARDARGTLPAQINNTWQAPGPAFTTYEFQAFNNAKQPSKKEWDDAVAWLARNNYHFDPKWKRWKKS